MAIKEIKDYSAVSTPAAGDKFITQQAADNVTRYATITQIISVFKGAASGIASLSAGTKVNEQPASITDHLDNTAGGTNAETSKAPTSNVMYDHGVATTGVHGLGADTICSEETADTKDAAAIAAHVAEEDPHTGYRLESADHTHLSTGAEGGVLNLFGAWETKTITTVYLAATDGFVCAYSTPECYWIKGYTDSSTPPTTVRAWQYEDDSSMQQYIMMPVKKGDYWKVTVQSNTATVYWMPVGG